MGSIGTKGLSVSAHSVPAGSGPFVAQIASDPRGAHLAPGSNDAKYVYLDGIPIAVIDITRKPEDGPRDAFMVWELINWESHQNALALRAFHHGDLRIKPFYFIGIVAHDARVGQG